MEIFSGFIIFYLVVVAAGLQKQDVVGLPLIQITHGKQTSQNIYEMQEKVHLEDFFWTGSGDEPPDYLKNVNIGISKERDIIVKTETVVATVYVDGKNEVDVPICLDCPKGVLDDDALIWLNGGGIPISLNYTNDRRYWLLTVLSGFYTQRDHFLLERKLAQLYRMAFIRQQNNHFGLSGNRFNSYGDTNRERRQFDQSFSTTDFNLEFAELTSPYSSWQSTSEQTQTQSDILESEWVADDLNLIKMNEIPQSTTASDFSYKSEYEMLDSSMNDDNIEQTTSMNLNWELFQDHRDVLVDKLVQINKFSSGTLSSPSSSSHLDIHLEHPLPQLKNDVRVMIRNLTQLSGKDVEAALSLDEISTFQHNEQIDTRPIANQTELIYSVFVNGHPVLAVTAANDMKLLTHDEVVNVIGKEVFMEAEPYLREPQATPLIPATRNSSTGMVSSVEQNVLLIGVSSIAVFLLLLLLLALLLMGRTHFRNEKRQNLLRTISRNELLGEPKTVNVLDDDLEIGQVVGTLPSHGVSTRDFGFENENSQNVNEMHLLKGAEPSSSRRLSISSSDNTSDSSVYCPVNAPIVTRQHLGSNSKVLTHANDQLIEQELYNNQDEIDDNDIYTSILSEKKKKRGKNQRQLKRRRYLSENRVGSLETSPAQSQKEYSEDEIEIIQDTKPSYVNLSRAEYIQNQHGNAERERLSREIEKIVSGHKVESKESSCHSKTTLTNILKDYSGTQQIIDKTSPHTVNRGTMVSTEISSDSESVGSFLSMQSIKAFPKATLPEPLSRVLEPVFVTYYDNMDDECLSKKREQRKETAIPTIDGFVNSPKRPENDATRNGKLNISSKSSDITWESNKPNYSRTPQDKHRYGFLNSNLLSPNRNPLIMRTQYEGLLEEAIEMYSSHDNLSPAPHPETAPTRPPLPNTTSTLIREHRGFSAGNNNSFLSRNSDVFDYRPLTAQPQKNHHNSKSNNSTQPPSPNPAAWMATSVYSSQTTLVRPTSAETYHHPQEFPGSTQNLSQPIDYSAAPIIAAIQTELRKFQIK